MLSDCKFALRCLRTAPVFSAIVVLTLALGVGATTAVFSVIDTVLLKPLPYPHQEQLVLLSEATEQVPNMSVSYPNFQDWRDRQRSFGSIGAFHVRTMNLVNGRDSERVASTLMSHDALETLAVAPRLGRWFLPEEDRPGGERVVLISESMWRESFGGRSDALGRQVRLGGQIYSIVGVMPEGFDFPLPGTRVWVPLGLFADAEGYGTRDNHPGIYAIGRLEPDATLESAQANMLTIARQLADEYPATNRGNTVSLQLVTTVVLGKLRQALWLLWGAAAFVLLIACANVANLILARGLARSREFAVRTAVGATQGQIVRQLLIENVVLGVLGSIVGVVIAAWSLDLVAAMLPNDIPGVSRLTLSTPVLAFGLGAGTLTMLLFGLTPALSASRVDPARSLSLSSQSATGSSTRWRAALVAGELALTVVLMSGAGLMIRTLQNVYSTDFGFGTARLLTFNWNLADPAYEQDSARLRVFNDALGKLATVPGVTHTGLINPLPLSGNSNQSIFHPEGAADPGPGRAPFTEVSQVSPGTFRTLDIPLLEGRVFTGRDSGAASNVVVIDQTLASAYFPERNAVGKRLKLGRADSTAQWLEVVGVVGHIQNQAIGQQTRYQAYVPYAATPPKFATFVLRTSSDPTLLHGAVRRALQEIEPGLPVFDIRTMDDVLSATVSSQRLSLKLLTMFAMLALLLSAIGLYAVFSYSVTQRRREFGVRMAIGASPSILQRLVLKQGLQLASVGLVAGVVGSLLLNRLLSALLYGASPQDPWVLSAVALVLFLVCLVACWLPAYRASRVDPLTALRVD